MYPTKYDITQVNAIDFDVKWVIRNRAIPISHEYAGLTLGKKIINQRKENV